MTRFAEVLESLHKAEIGLAAGQAIGSDCHNCGEVAHGIAFDDHSPTCGSTPCPAISLFLPPNPWTQVDPLICKCGGENIVPNGGDYVKCNSCQRSWVP